MLHTLAIFLDWFKISILCGLHSNRVSAESPCAIGKALSAGGEKYTPAGCSQGNLRNFHGIVVGPCGFPDPAASLFTPFLADSGQDVADKQPGSEQASQRVSQPVPGIIATSPRNKALVIFIKAANDRTN